MISRNFEIEIGNQEYKGSKGNGIATERSSLLPVLLIPLGEILYDP